MERITEIKQLKQGDRIWTINDFTGMVDVIEFVCIHPHNPAYSIFLNSNYDGMPKFYNERFTDAEYYRYDSSENCWRIIHMAEIAWLRRKISHINKRIKK